MEWRERAGARWLEADLDGARAAFSTRLGGVSEAPFDTLNLGLLTDDAEEAVGENRRRLATALGFEADQVVFARQVHGTRLVDHRAESPEGLVEADGHVVSAPGLAPLVFVADCLPVALAGPGGVAMVHAGWRGLAGGILATAAEAIEATSAAIGPGIGPCCYEVGDEVLAAFAGLGEGVAQGRMLDLPEVARRSLAGAGVERVESAGLCTSCERELFFSHRRDEGRTGRQAGVAWIEEG
ncbi:MAG TPA: polyphenol oxidase family protein [Solirubrobacterales bacterium]|nr:polyphenol oxidase family protein [Solirubrobacterales bacterium]